MILIGIYVCRQLKLATPILNFRVFGAQSYALAAIISTLNFATVMAAMYIIPQMLQQGLGASVSVAGLILLPAGLINAGVSLLSGHLSDLWGAKHFVRFGAILALLGAGMLLGVRTTTSLTYIVSATILLLGGSGLLLSPAQSYGLGGLSRSDSNDGSTIMNTLQQVFGALSVSISTTALLVGQTLSSQHSGATAYLAGARASFGWVTLLLILLAIAAFRVQDNRV